MWRAKYLISGELHKMRFEKRKSMLDQVILVNEQDQEIGTMDKIEAHRGSGKLHRAISVFLKNQKGEWLMQQRSEKKIVGALQWANTCCGNVRPGESYEECAQRRLREELGIVGVKLQPVKKFQYQTRCNQNFSEKEMDTVFTGSFSDTPKLNSDEVAAIQWMRDGEVVEKLAKDTEKKFVPWLHIMVEQQGIFSKLQMSK